MTQQSHCPPYSGGAPQGHATKVWRYKNSGRRIITSGKKKRCRDRGIRNSMMTLRWTELWGMLTCRSAIYRKHECVLMYQSLSGNVTERRPPQIVDVDISSPACAQKSMAPIMQCCILYVCDHAHHTRTQRYKTAWHLMSTGASYTRLLASCIATDAPVSVILRHHVVIAAQVHLQEGKGKDRGHDIALMRQHHHRRSQVWHAMSRDHTVLPAIHAFIHE